MRSNSRVGKKASSAGRRAKSGNRQVKEAKAVAEVRQQVMAHPPANIALTDYVVTQLLPAGYTVYEQRMSRGERAHRGVVSAEALQLRWMQMKRAQQAVMCPPGATAGLCNPLP